MLRNSRGTLWDFRVKINLLSYELPEVRMLRMRSVFPNVTSDVGADGGVPLIDVGNEPFCVATWEVRCAAENTMLYSDIVGSGDEAVPGLRRAILWLLENQYVESDEPDPVVCQVTIGSGMGLADSSAVANVAFHTRAEQWFTQTRTSRSATTAGTATICSYSPTAQSGYMIL